MVRTAEIQIYRQVVNFFHEWQKVPGLTIRFHFQLSAFNSFAFFKEALDIIPGQPQFETEKSGVIAAATSIDLNVIPLRKDSLS
jgi:hypothetical protein